MLEYWHKASLRVRLLIQFSIVFGIIVVTFLYISIQALNTSTQEALKERAIIAQLMADHVDAQLSQSQQILQNALASGKMNLKDGNLEPEKELLQNLYDHQILFQYINLFDESNRVLWQVPPSARISRLNLVGQSSKSVYGSSQSPFASVVDYRSGLFAVAITLPIVGSTGETEGYLRGWIDLADPRAGSFLYPYEPGKYGYTDLIDLIDPKGAILLSTREERVGQVWDHAGHLSALVQNKEATVGPCHACHDTRGGTRQKEILAFAPLMNIAWGVALHQPEDEVFANTRVLAYQFVVVGLLILVIFLGAVRTTTHGIVQPLQKLTRVARQIAAGDLSQSIPTTNIAEIISLRDSFEEMRLNLVQDRERLLGYQRDLERRVEDRTSELTQYRDYLLRANRNLTEVSVVATLLARSLDLTKTMSAVAERVRNAMFGDACGIFLSDDRELTLTLAAHQGLPAGVVSSIQRITYAELFPSECKSPMPPSGSAWHSACRAVLSKRLAWESLACVLLEAEGRMLGCLFVANQREKRFTTDDETLLSTLGWQIAMTVFNARLYETVKNREKERAKMLRQIITAQEEERKRIARELHDETSQALSALILGLDTMDSARAADPGAVITLQQANKTIAQQMLENIRRITADLRPSLLDDMGLVPTVARYGEKRLKPLGIAFHLETEGLRERRLASDLEITLFRIVQEAITNVIRHAHASSVTVQLACRDNQIALRVADDGHGFERSMAESPSVQDSALGLRGMQERASIIGGQFDLQTAPGQGTVITVHAPLRER